MKHSLQSPIAEIMISSYTAFMIFSGIFTILSYVKGRVQNNIMKVCLIINSLYAAFGLAVSVMMLLPVLSKIL